MLLNYLTQKLKEILLSRFATSKENANYVYFYYLMRLTLLQVEISRLYEYSSNDMIYHDTYFGGTNFMGEEVVYEENDTPIWGMNYYGITLDQALSEEAIDKALRPALMQVGSDDTIPVRGPKEYVNGDYKYIFNVLGNLDYFEGEETIYKNNKKVYVLKYHGGIIKK